MWDCFPQIFMGLFPEFPEWESLLLGGNSHDSQKNILGKFPRKMFGKQSHQKKLGKHSQEFCLGKVLGLGVGTDFRVVVLGFFDF